MNAKNLTLSAVGVAFLILAFLTVAVPGGKIGFRPPVASAATCGNGTVESGEACDDGDLVSNDGCSASCVIEIVCTDSDGGSVLTVKGTTVESINGVPMSGRQGSDYCNSDTVVTEYTCQAPYYAGGSIHLAGGGGNPCPSGTHCVDGACIAGAASSAAASSKNWVQQSNTALPTGAASVQTCGDGIDTPGVYGTQNGSTVFDIWYGNTGGGPSTAITVPSGSYPIAGDWWGTGKETLALYNSVSGVFTFYKSNSPTSETVTFTTNTAYQLPIAGDWYWDSQESSDTTPAGTDRVGLFNMNNGKISLWKNTVPLSGTAALPATPFRQYNMSFTGVSPAPNTTLDLLPIAGSWTNHPLSTPRDTVGFYDPINSYFYLRNTNTSGVPDTVAGYGVPNCGWKPLPGTWKVTNGYGADTLGVVDAIGCPTSSHKGQVYLRYSNTTGYGEAMFQLSSVPDSAKPVAADWCSGSISSAQSSTSMSSSSRSSSSPASSSRSSSSPASSSSAHPVCNNNILQDGEECENNVPCTNGATCNLTTCLCPSCEDSDTLSRRQAGLRHTVPMLRTIRKGRFGCAHAPAHLHAARHSRTAASQVLSWSTGATA
jgi:cysteine-rich repeat protein